MGVGYGQVDRKFLLAMERLQVATFPQPQLDRWQPVDHPLGGPQRHVGVVVGVVPDNMDAHLFRRLYLGHS